MAAEADVGPAPLDSVARAFLEDGIVAPPRPAMNAVALEAFEVLRAVRAMDVPGLEAEGWVRIPHDPRYDHAGLWMERRAAPRPT